MKIRFEVALSCSYGWPDFGESVESASAMSSPVVSKRGAT